MPRLCLIASECELCDYACGFLRFAEQQADLLDVLIQVVQSSSIEVAQGIGSYAKRLGIMDAKLLLGVRPRGFILIGKNLALRNELKGISAQLSEIH